MTKKIKDIFASAGKWVETTSGDYITCCDCGLVHRVEYKVETENGMTKFFARYWRNEKLTKQIRKEKI